MTIPYSEINKLIGKQRIRKAIKRIQIGLTIDPENIILLEHLSACFQLRGRYDESIEICKKGLLIAPLYIPIQLELINSYIYSNELTIAKELLEKFEAQVGETFELLLAYSRYYIQTKDFNNAEIYLNKAICAEPGNSKAHYLTGVLLLLQGNKHKAQQEFFQVYRLKKNMFNFVSMIESNLCLLGKWRGIISMILFVLSLFVPFPVNFFIVFYLLVYISWTLLIGIVFRDSKKIKSSIFLFVTYPPLMFICQRISGQILKYLRNIL